MGNQMRNSKKDRQYNDQKIKNKMTRTDLQNNTEKTKNLTKRTPLKPDCELMCSACLN